MREGTIVVVLPTVSEAAGVLVTNQQRGRPALQQFKKHA